MRASVSVHTRQAPQCVLTGSVLLLTHQAPVHGEPPLRPGPDACTRVLETRMMISVCPHLSRVPGGESLKLVLRAVL